MPAKRYAPDPPPVGDVPLDDLIASHLSRERARRRWPAALAVDPAVLARKSCQGRTNAATDKARAARDRQARWRHTNPVTRPAGGGPT